MPAIAGGAIGQTPTTDALSMSGGSPAAGNGAAGALGVLGGTGMPDADAARQQLESLIGQLRDVDQQLQSIAASMPQLAGDIQTMRTSIKRLVVKAAQGAMVHTASSDAVPMAGNYGG